MGVALAAHHVFGPQVIDADHATADRVGGDSALGVRNHVLGLLPHLRDRRGDMFQHLPADVLELDVPDRAGGLPGQGVRAQLDVLGGLHGFLQDPRHELRHLALGVGDPDQPASHRGVCGRRRGLGAGPVPVAVVGEDRVEPGGEIRDAGADPVGLLRRPVGQLAHLVGDDREALARVARPDRLDHGVERQDVGGPADLLDLADVLPEAGQAGDVAGHHVGQRIGVPAGACAYRKILAPVMGRTRGYRAT
jgi:hypothetical protein